MTHDAMHDLSTVAYEATRPEITGVAGTMWEEIALFSAMKAGNKHAMVDPEAERDENDKWPKGACIMLGPRMYTDDQLGKLDGPGRDIRKPDPNPELLKRKLAQTPKARMSKRQRAKAKRAERRARRRASR